MLANSGDPDQTPHLVASDLGLHCFPMSHTKDARLLWVNENNQFISDFIMFSLCLKDPFLE